MQAPRREVLVGGQVRTIEKFTGRKVAVALKVVGRLASTYHNIDKEITDYRRQYAIDNPIRLTRGQVQMALADIEGSLGAANVAEDLEDDMRERVISSLKATRNAYQSLMDGPLQTADYVERPGEANGDEVFMAVAGKVLIEDEVQDEVAQLIGLALMTNNEVGTHRRSGNLNQAMQELGDDTLDTVDLDELIDMMLVAGEMLLGDLSDRKERLGKLVRLFRPASKEVEAPEAAEPTVNSTSTSGKPTGSTDSEPPTDGEPTSPSTESLTPLDAT
jgi:hypothetical protein